MSCGHPLAFLPDRTAMGTLEPAMRTWLSLSPENEGRAYRLCHNYSGENVCNWAVPADDPNPYCPSCRLNRVIPDLSQPGTREAWARLEAAKRRLIYSLLGLGLPLLEQGRGPRARPGVRVPRRPRPRHAGATPS